MAIRIGVIPGDGVGPEVVAEAIKVIDKAAELDKFKVDWKQYPFSADHYLETDELISKDSLKGLKKNCDVLLVGCFGDPRVKTGLMERGILQEIRSYFDQFMLLRPVQLLNGVSTPLALSGDARIDFVLIRENTEEFGLDWFGRAAQGQGSQQFEYMKDKFKISAEFDLDVRDTEVSYQIGALTRFSCERIIKAAFEYAKTHGKKTVTFVDKYNTMECYALWREIVEDVSRDYGGISFEFYIIDFVATQLLRSPNRFEVICTPNLIGDILTDIGIVIQGGYGLAPGGSINPDGVSLFQPMHGSATNYARKHIVNPTATIRAAAMLLEHVGQGKSAALISRAVESVLQDQKIRTQDLGGQNSTNEFGDAIVDRMIDLHK